jgi:hypothetical protein
LAISVVVLLLFAACGEAEVPEPASAEVDAPKAAPAELAALGTQVVMGEPFRIDASPLPATLGAPWLEGTVVFKFESVAAGLSIEDEILPILSSAYGDKKGDFFAAEGVYLAVTYKITNEAKGPLRPNLHVADAFSVADDQGRLFPVVTTKARRFGASATARGISFPVSAAIALQRDNDDPRKWVDPGDTVTTVMAFDVPKDAGELRLRSEVLGIELPLGTLASMLP